METEAMHGGRGVASMTPRIFDRRPCRMPGRIASDARSGMALLIELILPVRYMDEHRKEVTAALLRESITKIV